MKGIISSVKPISLAVALSFVGGAYAVGTGTIVSGTGNITQGKSEVIVKQNSDKMIVNWDNMNVGKNEKLNFNQPGANSAVLNKINSIDPTVIQGVLNANGKVFVVNSNGVLIGNGATINVGSLVASSLDINNGDFDHENFHFSGKSNGKVVNEGRINAKGSVGLISSGEVNNHGNITTSNGNVNLASGSDITLSFPTFGKMNVKINQGSLKALVNNGGVVVAKGGNVMLTAWATDQLTRGVINNTGVLEATNLTYNDDGSVYLISKGNQHGSSNVGGTLSSGLMGQNYVEGADIHVHDGALLSSAYGTTSLHSSKKDGYVEFGNAKVNSSLIVTADNVLTTASGRNAAFKDEVRVNTTSDKNNIEVANAANTSKNGIKAGHGVIDAHFVDAIVKSNQKLSVSAGSGNIDLNNAQQNYGNLSLTSRAGEVNLNSKMRAERLDVSGQNITLASGASVDINSNGNFHANKNLALNGDVSARDSLNLSAEGTLSQAVGAKVSANRNASYQGKNIALNGDVEANRLDVMAREGLVQGTRSSVHASNATLNGGMYDLSAGNNNISQILAHAKSLNMASASSVEFTSGSRIENNFKVNGTKNVTLKNLTILKDADIKANSDLTIDGGLYVGGDASLKAKNIKDDHQSSWNNNSTVVGGKAELTAENNIDLGTITAGTQRRADLVLTGKAVNVVKKSASNNVIVNITGTKPVDPVDPTNPTDPGDEADIWKFSPDDPLSRMYPDDKLHQAYIQSHVNMPAEQFIEHIRASLVSWWKY